MKKSILMLAAVAGLFAACTNEDAVLEQPVAQQGQTPVTFGAYVNRATTRAGEPGTITTDLLKTTDGAIRTAGFGVFGYYTNNEIYSQYATPNFMYNQQVKSDGTDFSYTPVKYWPNEFGSKDASTGAFSDDVDKVSFFAYAPYVAVDPTTGIVNGDNDAKTNNIVQISRNSATGDPMIKYVVDVKPASSVDLLWGVVPATTDYATISSATATAPTEGLPFLNLAKAANDKKVDFNFKHALAKLNVSIDAYVDGTDDTNPVAAGTKIYVRSITFTGLATKGVLNLNNTAAGEPLWLDFDGRNPIVPEAVTFYDGRKDGKEATENGEQVSEGPVMLNTVLLQDAGSTTAGVTNTAVNLFQDNTDATSSIYVIPTKNALDVRIVYDVETLDGNLATYVADGVAHGSSIENNIYKNSVFANIEAGKAYTLKLHLGMNSVKFDAAVTGWDAQPAVDTDLPENNN